MSQDPALSLPLRGRQWGSGGPKTPPSHSLFEVDNGGLGVIIIITILHFLPAQLCTELNGKSHVMCHMITVKSHVIILMSHVIILMSHVITVKSHVITVIILMSHVITVTLGVD